MYVGRKLLFHRSEHVDDSVGTYVTDYVMGASFFVITGFMIYKIWKRRNVEEANYVAKSGEGIRYWVPWNWPRQATTSVTITTYATVLFIVPYGLMGIFGGLTHEFLQKVEPYSGPSDGMTWLIVWRCATTSSIFAVFFFFTLCEQMFQQESFLTLPEKARKVFYALLVLASLAALIDNFSRLFGDDPFNITSLFLIFMACVLVYGILTLMLVIRAFVKRCKRNRDEGNSETPDEQESSLNLESFSIGSKNDRRWDLILHSLCPWLIVLGGVFSFILTPSCSRADDPHGLHGCPLPNVFNHNAVMHLIHMIALACAAAGENFAMNRRAKISKLGNNNEMENDRKESTVMLLV